MEMKSKMKEIGDTQIVMITWSQNYNIAAIKKFYRDYGLKKYPNITMGTEGYSYTVLSYFEVKTTPYIAIYNPKGKLVKSFSKEPTADEVIAAVKKAK
jgi:hypothetical protein